MPATFRIKIKSSRKRRPPARLQDEYKRKVANLLKRVAKDGVENIRSEIQKRDLVNTGNMLSKVRSRRTPQGVRFEVNTDYAGYLDQGIRKHKMLYLKNASRPIPVDAANGIFRWATPESIRNGAWVHPGFRRGKGFMAAAVRRTRDDFHEALNDVRFKVF
jgi:hypothetical protein